VEAGFRSIISKNSLVFSVCIVIFTAFLALPIIALFLHTNPSSFFSTLTDKTVTNAIILSLGTSCISLIFIVLFGTPAAYYHARTAYPGRSIVEIFIDLPIVLPPAVAGLALLLLYGRMGLIGRYFNMFGIDIAFTTVAVILAQIFVSSPFYVRQAKGLFEQLDPSYELTARTLGASPLYLFKTVVLPLTFGGLLSGAVMTFARALGEFGATIMVAGNIPGITQTMPLAIYGAMEGDFNVAITLSVLLVIISFVIMAVIRVITLYRSRNA